MDLAAHIRSRGSEFALFALTPPRLSVSSTQAAHIANATLDRLGALSIDGLVLYDIDDESDRNPAERPFPFLPTLDPATFHDDYLARWKKPVIIYRAVGKYSEADLRAWLTRIDANQMLTVFVGASSRDKQQATTLVNAQELRAATRPDVLLGGVAIPERHTRRGSEHLRLIAKQQAGCDFFVTQVVFDVNASKDLVSDYRYGCADRQTHPVPIVFTFSVCGSMKTLEFLQWLGVDVPRWIHNDLQYADDTLERSYELAVANALEIMSFCRRMEVPFGISVESVSNRADEIAAAVALSEELSTQLRR